MTDDLYDTDPLFTPLDLEPLMLPNRVLMSPMTRSRARQPGDVQGEMHARYYAQRASAGMIVTEATQVSPQGKGYIATPGIYSEEQVEGWRTVTTAVHANGGRIFAQLWHVGRISHVSFQPDDEAPLAPSAIRANAKTFTAGGLEDVSEPRALEIGEIKAVVDEFRRAAENAEAAGFDGVELHGGNGYLIDQFLRDGSNRRKDRFGGRISNRIKFPLQVVEALTDVWGPERVGVRISPLSGFNDMRDSDPTKLFSAFVTELDRIGVAFIDVVERAGEVAPGTPLTAEEDALASTLRDNFSNAYLANGSYDAALARERIDARQADGVFFGRPFLANPDLPERIRRGAELEEARHDTFYGGEAEGYLDYPTLSWLPVE
ncbi:MAG: alkene reductase [Acidobacteriota bacterium]